MKILDIADKPEYDFSDILIDSFVRVKIKIAF